MRAVIFILITLFELNQCLRINIDAHSVVKEDSTASASTERGREGKDDDDDGDDGDDGDDRDDRGDGDDGDDSDTELPENGYLFPRNKAMSPAT